LVALNGMHIEKLHHPQVFNFAETSWQEEGQAAAHGRG
jgi:hypothetical protein